eukprot:gene10015-11855_t
MFCASVYQDTTVHLVKRRHDAQWVLADLQTLNSQAETNWDPKSGDPPPSPPPLTPAQQIHLGLHIPGKGLVSLEKELVLAARACYFGVLPYAECSFKVYEDVDNLLHDVRKGVHIIVISPEPAQRRRRGPPAAKRAATAIIACSKENAVKDEIVSDVRQLIDIPRDVHVGAVEATVDVVSRTQFIVVAVTPRHSRKATM